MSKDSFAYTSVTSATRMLSISSRSSAEPFREQSRTVSVPPLPQPFTWMPTWCCRVPNGGALPESKCTLLIAMSSQT